VIARAYAAFNSGVARGNLSIYKLVAGVALRVLRSGVFSARISPLTSNLSASSVRFASSCLAQISSASERVHAIIERQISPELLLGQLPVHVLFGVVFVLHESFQRD